MIQIIPLSMDQIVACLIEEQLTVEDVGALQSVIADKAQRHKRLHLYVEARPLRDGSPADVLRKLIAFTKIRECFDRIVLAAFGTRRNLRSDLVRDLLPDAAVATFDLDKASEFQQRVERAKAVAWLLADEARRSSGYRAAAS